MVQITRVRKFTGYSVNCSRQPERRNFFRLQVNERVQISLVEVYLEYMLKE